MSTHQVSLKRTARGMNSSTSLGVDAVNGLNSIAGVSNVEILQETESVVTLVYEWDGRAKNLDADVLLAKFNVELR